MYVTTAMTSEPIALMLVEQPLMAAINPHPLILLTDQVLMTHRENRATAFNFVYAWFCSSLFALSIASSSGSVSILSFGSGCFGAGRLAISKSRKRFVAACGQARP